MLTVLLTALATGALVLLALNFTAGEKKVQQQLPRLYSTASPDFERALGSLLGPGIVGGNGVTELLNGDQIFPPMLAAIQAAQKSITFETYIYWSGDIGKQFADALSERARAGVRVHVLLDWVGSAKMDESYLTEMKEAGVQIEKFHKPHWYNLARLNNRTHRKLLVVDGQVGFTGGVGIAPQWMGNAQDPDHWRDMHFKVEGPVVAQVQAAFNDNWIKATGDVLNGTDYFPPSQKAGDMDAHLFISSPAGGSESMHLMYLMGIAAAEHSIDLQASYFVPDELIHKALIAARQRGVTVRILVPGEHIDSDTVRLASKAEWGPLLQAGVEIYEYLPTMMHNKLLIIDKEMVSVGSTNFDVRSFRLNDEASLNVYDHAFAEKMTRVFNDDLKHTKRYTYEVWEKRPLTEKLIERFVLPIKSQL